MQRSLVLIVCVLLLSVAGCAQQIQDANRGFQRLWYGEDTEAQKMYDAPDTPLLPPDKKGFAALAQGK